MNNEEFLDWKQNLGSIDPYENEKDCEIFFRLLSKVEGQLDGPIIDALLGTFTNADDYGVQERVMVILDGADPSEYASRLAAGFEGLIRRSSEKEWPLIILGRIFNSDDLLLINAIVDAARNNQVLREFMRSDEFLEEYPEVEGILNSAGI
ncbi:hypothetical protein [Pseudomonas sp. NPDC089401]|uniref:hypothetical protein n=1 Tax=Pseudomonas sp. NPDC089401 TaxID=3364462 RepID=UPI0037F7C9B2